MIVKMYTPLAFYKDTQSALFVLNTWHWQIGLNLVWLFQRDADNLPLETANDENDDELCGENNFH